MPLPAITASSSTGWMKTPSRPGKRESWIACHQSANGTGITVPPSRSIAAIFVFGA